ALAVLEDRDEHLIARLARFLAGGDLHFAAEARRRHVGLLEVARRRLVALRRVVFDQAQLHGLVAVRLRVLRLDDDAGAGLDHRRRMDGAVRVEDLGHAQFLAEDARDRHYLCSLPKALISTSTPAGRSSFISASTVCGVGSKMSM